MTLNYSLSYASTQTMFIYQPDPNAIVLFRLGQTFVLAKERIVWHSGESTQLHYEINRGTGWKPIATTTINDFPTGVKELQQQFEDYYSYISPEVQRDLSNYDC